MYKPSLNEIKDLRGKTGAGIKDCKTALIEKGGDISEAIDWLRTKGIAKAAKKADRAAAEGKIASIVDGQNAVILEVNCETDFVARTPAFQDFATSLAQFILDNKPTDLNDLFGMTWDGASVKETIQQMVLKTGENVQVRRFVLIESDNQIFSYIHTGDRLGVIGEFTGPEGLSEFADELGMHIVASAPQFLSGADIPSDLVEKERSIQIARAQEDPKLTGKPDKVIQGAVRGRIEKWKKEISLMDQMWIHDDNGKTKVSALLNQMSAEQGQPVSVLSFNRFALGDGIEKKEGNLADEVAAMMNE